MKNCNLLISKHYLIIKMERYNYHQHYNIRILSMMNNKVLENKATLKILVEHWEFSDDFKK